MFREFGQFLREFNVVVLAIGFVMGTASTSLVNSLVKDVVMPLVEPLLPGDSWREAAFHLGSSTISYGAFLAELINFVVLALIIFIVAKKILKMEKIETK